MADELDLTPPPEAPVTIRCVTEPYDGGNPEHLRQFLEAGSPPDAGNGWGPTFYEDLQEDGSWLRRRPSPDPAPVTDVEVQFKKIQQRLDYNEFLRTGRAVDPRGAVSVARAWAAVCMLLNRWHYPTKADLDTDVNKAILQKIYADPTANTNEKSSTAQKQAVLHYTLVMLEGQAFGIDYQAELGAYERTASGAFREKVKSDPRDWLLLPVHKWETCLAMFLEVMG